MKFEHWRHYVRGRVLRVLGHVDAARAAFTIAMTVDPSHAQTARHLASIAAEREQWDIAEHWFARVVNLAPEDADAWFNLGFVRGHTGDSTAAIIAFAEALKLKPALDRANYGMGLAHARLGRHIEAAAAFGACVELQPMNGEAYYQWGMALHHAGHQESARHVIERLARFEPQRARQLLLETGHDDLLHLIPELPI